MAIARAIVNQPAILPADEPTGNLDSKNSAAVLGLLRDLNEHLGQTVLLITYDPGVASYAHRLVHMLDGQIAESVWVSRLPLEFLHFRGRRGMHCSSGAALLCCGRASARLAA